MANGSKFREDFQNGPATKPKEEGFSLQKKGLEASEVLLTKKTGNFSVVQRPEATSRDCKEES